MFGKTQLSALLCKQGRRGSKRVQYLLLILLTGLFTLVFFNVEHSTIYAQQTPPTGAIINAFSGVVKVKRDSGESKDPSEYEIMQSYRDKLWIANSSSFANITFFNQSQTQTSDFEPAIRVEGRDLPTLYNFPCRIERPGSITVAWGFQEKETSFCNRFEVNVGDGATGRSAEGNLIARKSYFQLAVENNSLPQQITVARSEDLTFTHIYSASGIVTVDVLVGAVEITDVDGEVINVNSGNRYAQGSSEIVTINLSRAAASSSIRRFLNDEQWLPEVKPLLDKLKVALQDQIREQNRGFHSFIPDALLGSDSGFRRDINQVDRRPEIDPLGPALSGTLTFTDEVGDIRSGTFVLDNGGAIDLEVDLEQRTITVEGINARPNSVYGLSGDNAFGTIVLEDSGVIFNNINVNAGDAIRIDAFGVDGQEPEVGDSFRGTIIRGRVPDR